MSRVGEQCQRVGGEPADHLGNHVRRSQYECHAQAPAVSDDVGGTRVMVVVLMRHLTSLLTTRSSVERFGVGSR